MKSLSKSTSSSSSSSDIEVGSNVSVQTTNGTKNGTVQYIGETKFATGEWIGVKLEAPEGKNDGSVSGERYFECEPLYGIFVKRAQVKQASSAAAASTSSTSTTTSSSESSKSGTLTAREKYEALKAKRLAGSSSASASISSTKVAGIEKEKVIVQKEEVKPKDVKKEKEVVTTDSEIISDSKDTFHTSDVKSTVTMEDVTDKSYLTTKNNERLYDEEIKELCISNNDLKNQLSKLKETNATNENERYKLEKVLSDKEQEVSLANSKIDDIDKKFITKVKEMDDLLQKISKHEKEKEQLEVIIADKEKEINELTTAMKQTKSNDPPPVPLAEDINKIKEEVKAQTLREVDFKYTSMIDDKNNEIKKLQLQIQNISKDATDKEEANSLDLDLKKKEIVKISKECDTAKSRIVDLEKQVDNEKKKNSNIVEDLEKQIDIEKKKSSGTIVDLEKQIKDLKEKLDHSSKALTQTSALPKVEELQAQIDELNDNLELLTLDKEQLTLDKEILEEKIVQLEKDLTIALESDGNVGAAAYAEENAKLRAALLKLNALSNEERTLAERQKKDLEELSGAIKQKEQEVSNLREFKSTASNQISDLKAHVDATSLYEEIIEKLTEKNEQLVARNSHLEDAVRDLEATVEVSEELDMTQREEISKLNKSVDATEIAKQAIEEKYKAMSLKYEEASEVINKFRRSMDSLKDELATTHAKYDEAVAGSLVSGDLLRESGLLKMKYASLVEKMIFTEKSKREIENLMWSMKVYNSRYDEVFSTLSLTASEKKRLVTEVGIATAAYRSAVLFRELSDIIQDSSTSSSSAQYADTYIILMRATTALWQLSLKAITEDSEVALPSTLMDLTVEFEQFATSGDDRSLNVSLIRTFVSEAEEMLPPSLSSLFDECLHHSTSQGLSNDLSGIHVMIHFSSLANLIMFASNLLTVVLTVDDEAVEVVNTLKSIRLEVHELLESNLKVRSPSVMVSMRNHMLNAFTTMGKIVDAAKHNGSNQDSSTVIVNLKTTISFIRNAANLLKNTDDNSSGGAISPVVIFNINKPQNIWKMIIDGEGGVGDQLRWRKAMAAVKVTLGSWEESGSSIKGLNENIENLSITLTLRADELKAAKAANEELLVLLNKESERKAGSDEVTVLREAIGILEGRCENLENENRQLKKASKIGGVPDKSSSTSTSSNTGKSDIIGGVTNAVDSSIVNSLAVSRLNWKKLATFRMTSFLKPLPYEGGSIINMNRNTNENITKINRIEKKARASIKIVSLGGIINNNHRPLTISIA